MNRPTAKRALGFLTVIGVFAAFAVPASASTNCDGQAVSKPFAPWLDFANYTMPGDGSFEAGAAGWQLDRASVVAENEPFAVHGAGDSRALKLPAGGSAVSTPICIGLGHPTLRFFARSSTTLTLSTLRVDVRFQDALGNQRALPVGVVLPGSRWQPTLPLPVVVNLLSLLPSGPSEVRLAFTPVGSATWWIDDVYVDPKARN